MLLKNLTLTEIMLCKCHSICNGEKGRWYTWSLACCPTYAL